MSEFEFVTADWPFGIVVVCRRHPGNRPAIRLARATLPTQDAEPVWKSEVAGEVVDPSNPDGSLSVSCPTHGPLVVPPRTVARAVEKLRRTHYSQTIRL